MSRRLSTPGRFRFRPSLLTGLLLGLALAGAFSSAPAGELRGRIRGTAVDLKGRPAAGLLVQLFLSGSGLVHVTNTDEKGIYAFEDLDAGSYDVDVSGPGFQRQIKKAILVQPPFRNIVDFRLVPGPLSEAPPSAAAAYKPPPGDPALQDVSGTFTDKDRHPIPDVSLSLVNPGSGAAFRAQSDREGKVLIHSVPEGIYRVLVSSPGFVTVSLPNAEVSRTTGMILNLSLVEYPLNFQGRPEDLTPAEKPVPPDYRPPGP